MQKKQTTQRAIPSLEELITKVKPEKAWLALYVETLEDVDPLLRAYEPTFQFWATANGYEEFRVILPSGKYFPIHASLSTSNPNLSIISEQSFEGLYVHSGMPINKPLYRLMESFIEASKPKFLLENGSDNQVWINQKAADMIESSGEEAVKRSIANYWRNEDREKLYKKLASSSQPFFHTYRAILNDVAKDEQGNPIWFEATSLYTPIEINGRYYRISETQDFKIIGAQPKLATFR